MSKFLPTILQGHGLLALTQLLTSRTDNGGRERQNSKSRFPIFFPSDVDVGSAAYSVLCVCVRQRKVRRDILTSPTVPERGRSRSREAYPHMVRSGSRGRSLSVERRGSRNSSESSLVDMEEMAQTLFR